MNEEQNQPDKQGGEERAGAPARSSLLRGDDSVGIVILAFCAVVVYLTTNFDEVPAMLSQGIPPTQFPRMMVGVIGLLTVIMVIQARRRQDSSKSRVPVVAFLTAGLLLAFVAVIELVGTLGAIVLFCIALPVLWGERRYGWIAAYAVVFPVCVYLLFVKVLEVRFPLGLLESILS